MENKIDKIIAVLEYALSTKKEELDVVDGTDSYMYRALKIEKMIFKI